MTDPVDDASPLRVGIVGAGGIAPPHITALLALGVQVSILARSGARALADRHGLTLVDSLDDLIDQVDVIDILTPTTTHADIALRAIARGRHVICEKPLAADADEAAGLVRAAAEAGTRLFPAHVVRYFSDYAWAKQEIDAGRIGDLVEQNLLRRVAAPPSGWFFDEDAGGGLIRDLMIHDLDQAVWVAGPATTVSATQDPPSGAGRVTPPVRAEVVLTHRNGVVSRVCAEWAEAGTPFRTRAEFVGTGGVLRIGNNDDSEDSAPLLHVPPASDTDPYLAQIADFVEALRERRDARVSPADGVAAVALVDAAYASLASGQPVSLAP